MIETRSRATVTEDPLAAARALGAGRLAVLPTETVYGLAADARQPAAVRRCFATKGRPSWHAVIAHVEGLAVVSEWSAEVPWHATSLMGMFWPGPLTVVVRLRPGVNPTTAGDGNTVAFRSPAHDAFRAVMGHLRSLHGEPAVLAAPSANRFGRVSPTSAAQASSAIGPWLGPDDVILDAGPCAIGLESTVVDCTGKRVRVLRPGAIGVSDLAEAIGDHAVDSLAHAVGATGPGTLESHYSPTARVVVTGAAELADPIWRARHGGAVSGLVALDSVSTPSGMIRLASPTSVRDYAAGLYSWLNDGDDRGCEVIVAVPPESAATASREGALAAAIVDRLRRAAAPVKRRLPSPGDG